MSKFIYKIALIGDGGVGKSSFVKRHVTGEFNNKYIPTIGVEVHPVSFNTNHGRITFNLWDCAGQEKYNKLCSDYLVACDAGLIFFDVTNPISFLNVDQWKLLFLQQLLPESKILICGNKCDLKDRKVEPTKIRAKYGKNLQNYCEISARINYNFEKPFLELARLLTGHKDLYFIDIYPAITPITITPFEQPKTEVKEHITIDTFKQKLENVSIEGLFNLVQEKDAKINELQKLINEKKLILDKIYEVSKNNLYIDKQKKLMQKCFPELIRKVGSRQKNIFNEKLIEGIKLGTSGYMRVAVDIWVLNKEEFIKKHQNSLPIAYIEALVSLYDKSRIAREEILVKNEIFNG